MIAETKLEDRNIEHEMLSQEVDRFRLSKLTIVFVLSFLCL